MSRDLFIPNSTQIPDVLLDVWMAKLTGAEFKVLMYICRRTYGFRKESDSISVSQIATGIVKRDGERLDSGTGISESSIKASLATLEKHGLVTKGLNQRADGSFLPSTYTISTPCSEGGVGHSQAGTPPKTRGGTGQPLAQGVGHSQAGGVGQPLAPQHTVVQNTVLQDTVCSESPYIPQGGGPAKTNENENIDVFTPAELQSEPLPQPTTRSQREREKTSRDAALTAIMQAYRAVRFGRPTTDPVPAPEFDRMKKAAAELLDVYHATPQQVAAATDEALNRSEPRYVTLSYLSGHWTDLTTPLPAPRLATMGTPTRTSTGRESYESRLKNRRAGIDAIHDEMMEALNGESTPHHRMEESK